MTRSGYPAKTGLSCRVQIKVLGFTDAVAPNGEEGVMLVYEYMGIKGECLTNRQKKNLVVGETIEIDLLEIAGSFDQLCDLAENFLNRYGEVWFPPTEWNPQFVGEMGQPPTKLLEAAILFSLMRDSGLLRAPADHRNAPKRRSSRKFGVDEAAFFGFFVAHLLLINPHEKDRVRGKKVRSDAAMGRAVVADKKKRANQANIKRLQAMAGKIQSEHEAKLSKKDLARFIQKRLANDDPLKRLSISTIRQKL